jgi:hypothetical protein
VIPREAEAETRGETEDPLPHGRVREHVVDELRGALGHAAPPVAWTETTPVARVRDQAIEPALLAPKPREAPGRPPASEEVAKLLRDKPGQPVTLAQTRGLRLERLEVVAHDLVEDGRAGLPRHVGRRRRGATLTTAAEAVPSRNMGTDGRSARRVAKFCDEARRRASQIRPGRWVAVGDLGSDR